MSFELEPAILVPAILEATVRAGLGVVVAKLVDDRPIAVFHNEAACAIMGWSSEEILGEDPLHRLVAPEERARIAEYIRRRTSGAETHDRYETMLIRKDGKRILIWFASSRVTIHGTPAAVVFFADLTRQRESEARFDKLVESAPDGIVISRDGRVLYANPAAARLLGHEDAHSLVGAMMSQFLAPSELAAMRARVGEMIATGRPLPPREYPAVRKDGTPIVAEITSLPTMYDGGPAVIAIARDVTERARMQARLAHADRLAALGTLAAGVAHEVNNPLAYVTLGLEALERQIAQAIPDDEARASALRLLADVSDGAQRVARIARELKSFARADDGEVGPVEIGAIVRAAERMVGRELSRNAMLELHLGAPIVVHANGPRLHQVFVNLLLNAAQAGEDNRIVRIVVRVERQGEQVIVEIRDDGRGIKTSDLPKIFDPFFTTKQPGIGTGLGLFVCLGIVRQLGGDITVESKEGQGATFRVSLPLAPSTAATKVVSEAPARHQRKASILIVDDEPHVGSMLGQLLSNHEIVVVRSAEAALATLLDERSFDVVFCDLVMPGMTGMDLYERIAKERPGLERRFVLMTGGAFTSRARQFLESVPNTCIEKPFRFQTVEEILARALDGHSQA